MKVPTNERIVDLRNPSRKLPSFSPTPPQSPTPPPRSPAASDPIRKEQVENPYESRALFAWDAPEFIKYEKDLQWLLSLIIIVIALIGYFLLTQNYLGAIVTILSSFMIYLYSLREPRGIHFEILPLGVVTGEKLYEFDRLKSFWIFYELPDFKEVSIRTKATFSPYLYLPLGSTNPVEVRNALLKFLPEKEEHELLTNRIARKLRF